MIATQNRVASALAQRLAQLVQDANLPMRELWVRSSSDGAELWLVARPGHHKRRSYYELPVQLQKDYPNTPFEFSLVNQEVLDEEEIRLRIPDDAVRIARNGPQCTTTSSPRSVDSQ